jgi:ribosomal protein L14E/L6E/L27E
MEKGMIVKALAGKEKNQVFVVIDVAENYAYIADGKRLKKDKPKKKSVKHIQKVSTKRFPIEELEINDEKVNASIRKFIKNL